MTTACELIACARQFIGVRFAHQGRTKAGLDCLGLLILTAQTLGLQVAGEEVAALDVPHYGTRPDVLLLKEKLDTHLLPVARTALREGDVVLLKVQGVPQHLALLADYPMPGELAMIHAYAPARQVVEHRYDAHWRRDTYAAYRLPGLS
ncbi:MAG: NlpC/P60 family protein [Alphaproteobacteria bacterium]|nr:NlpC/P60 family protein [Alphaproteobacteria bacterium]